MNQITMPDGSLSNTANQDEGSIFTGISIYRIFKLLMNVFCFSSGLALIGIGSVLIYHVLLEIYQAYHHIDQNVFVGTLIDWLENKSVFWDTNDRPFLFGTAGAVVISMTFACLLASLCTQIALMFFKAGIQVLGMRFKE